MLSLTGKVIEANKGKQLIDCTYAEIEDMVRGAIALMGLKPEDTPSDNVKQFLINEVKTELYNYTREEIRLALSLAMKKEIDFDTKLYGALISVDWFARLMTAYKLYRNERIIAERNKPKPQQAQLPESNVDVFTNGIKTLYAKVVSGNDTPDDWWLLRSLNEARYLYLERTKAIEFSKDEKWEIYDRAKEQYRSELGRDEAIAMANLDRPSVSMIRQAISQFELDNTDTSNGAAIRQIARILSLQEWMYQLRDNNEQLPKLTK